MVLWSDKQRWIEKHDGAAGGGGLGHLGLRKSYPRLRTKT